MQLQPGIPFVGPITNELEEKTSQSGSKYFTFTIKDYFAGFVKVRVFGNIHDKMAEHLRVKDAVVLVNAESAEPWVPEDENKNVKRYQQGDRANQVIINVSCTATGGRLRFLPTTTGSTTNTQDNSNNNTGTSQPTAGDTVRGGNDSQQTQQQTQQQQPQTQPQTQQTQQTQQNVEQPASGGGDQWGGF